MLHILFTYVPPYTDDKEYNDDSTSCVPLFIRYFQQGFPHIPVFSTVHTIEGDGGDALSLYWTVENLLKKYSGRTQNFHYPNSHLCMTYRSLLCDDHAVLHYSAVPMHRLYHGMNRDQIKSIRRQYGMEGIGRITLLSLSYVHWILDHLYDTLYDLALLYAYEEWMNKVQNTERFMGMNTDFLSSLIYIVYEMRRLVSSDVYTQNDPVLVEEEDKDNTQIIQRWVDSIQNKNIKR